MLLPLPVMNAQISSIVALYGDAQRALDSLISEATWLPQTKERRDVINRQAEAEGGGASA